MRQRRYKFEILQLRRDCCEVFEIEEIGARAGP